MAILRKRSLLSGPPADELRKIVIARVMAAPLVGDAADHDGGPEPV